MGEMNAYSIRRIDDELLRNISGGSGAAGTVCVVGIATAAASVPLGLGCFISGELCKHEAKKGKRQGNDVKAQKLEKAGRILLDTSIGIGAVGAAGLITGIVPLVVDKNSFVHRYKGR